MNDIARIGVLAMLLGGAAPTVRADEITGYFYSVPNNHAQDPDFQGGIDGGTVTGLVQNTLGPDGLPVVSAKGATFGRSPEI